MELRESDLPLKKLVDKFDHVAYVNTSCLNRYVLEVSIITTRAVESKVPSSDSDSWQFRLSDSDSGPTPTFSCISYLK